MGFNAEAQRRRDKRREEGENQKVESAEGAENGEESARRHWKRHFGIEKGERSRERCGGRGLRVFAVRIPAASDLVGIYEDVGAVLITLSTSIVPSFRFATSVSRGSAIGAIRSPPGYYPFERKIFPPVSSTKGNHR